MCMHHLCVHHLMDQRKITSKVTKSSYDLALIEYLEKATELTLSAEMGD